MKNYKKILLTFLICCGFNSISAQDWSLTGNSGTDPSVNFIGTNDNKNLIFKRNSTFSGIIGSATINSGGGIAGNGTSFGYMAMGNNGIFPGYSGVAFGSYALSNNTSGQLNAAFGIGAMQYNTDGEYNVAVGSYALRQNIIGIQNIAIGYQSLNKNTEGGQNVAIGVEALEMNDDGGNNIAIGFRSLENNESGSSNIAIGSNAMRYYDVPNTNNNFANIAIGNGSATHLKSGEQNTFIGVQSGPHINGSGDGNNAFGYETGYNLLTGSSNLFFGNSSGRAVRDGSSNSFFGTQSGWKLTAETASGTVGNANTFIGSQSGYDITSGSKNTFLGRLAGRYLLTGSSNTFIGNVQVMNSPSTATRSGNDSSGTIILADGDNNHRFFIHNNGYAGIGLGNNVIPNNRLEIRYGADGFSGLRFTNLKNTNAAIVNPTDKVLTVDENGDVILVYDEKGNESGVELSCSTENFVPVNSATPNVLDCSQIYDNGTSVGIATTGPFDYTLTSIPPFSGGDVPISGTLKLDVNGVVRATGFFATSDKKFKKEIKDLEGALEKVNSLQGKKYHWNKEEFKNKNFSDELQYGFIAQEVQEILPEIVIKDANGDLAMNYIALVPVLVEAIKEQQNEISETKDELKSLLEDVKNLKNEVQILKEKLSDKELNESLENSTQTNLLKVYPNPSKDEMNISFVNENISNDTKLMIYDMNGTFLSAINIQKSQNKTIEKKIRKEDFGSGVFIVSLVSEGKIKESKKVIFQ